MGIASKKGILIGATHSGAGKTTVTLAILEALIRRGLKTQAFKVGPDYLDPTFHEVATGRPSRNLDGWMMGRGGVLKSFHQAAMDSDFSVVEGVMGLFDGVRGRSEEGSSAQIARWLSMPVVLVIDAKGLARTAGAIIRGIQQFDSQINIQGIIFNRVGSENHLEILKESVEPVCKVKVLGGVPNDSSLEIPARHLGLVQARESLSDDLRIKLAEMAESHINLEAILKMEFFSSDHHHKIVVCESNRQEGRPLCKIGVARDKAFHFYYQDNLDLLEESGAHPVFFSPIFDSRIPEVEGLYFGGGYPEVYAEVLSRNRSMLESIRAFAGEGGPIYGECGGFMYLSKGIETTEGKFFPMAGLLPGQVKMGKKLKALGYREIVSQNANLLLHKGETARGHEYHYSEWIKVPPDQNIKGWEEPYRLYRGGEKEELKKEGFARDNIMASYVHLHFASNPNLVKRWISACMDYRSQSGLKNKT